MKKAKKIICKNTESLIMLMVFFLVFADQYTKYWAKEYWQSPVNIFDFFSLRFVENTGIAFSIPIPKPIIMTLVFSAIGFLVYLIFNETKSSTSKNKKLAIGYGFILSGALGNAIDRLWRGKVTDFISFWNFPVFNLADVWISIGTFTLLLYVKSKRNESHY